MEPVTTEQRLKGAMHGLSDASAIPVHVPRSEVPVQPPARVSWARGVARMVRNSAIALALLAAIPIGIVAKDGEAFLRPFAFDSRAERVSFISEGVRSYALPKDASITPMQAGIAFNALSRAPTGAPSAYTWREPTHRADHPWDTLTITPDMFLASRPNPNIYTGPSWKIIAAASRGFTPKETEYLRAVAHAPIWRDVALVARAPAIDMLGARFQFPLAENATWEAMPLPSLGSLKDIAFEELVRAAWYISQDQPDSAEAVLREAISFGLAVKDNGNTAIEQLVGHTAALIGREGQQEFYQLRGKPLARRPELQPFNGNLPNGPKLTPDEVRRRLIARVTDPSAPRAERVEAVRRLEYSACSNVKEMLFGLRPESQRAIDAAKLALARYPSERAVLDLAARPPRLTLDDIRGVGALAPVIASASAVVGTVIHNERLPACSLVSYMAPAGK